MRIKEIRISRGLTQRSVADAIGLSYSGYSNLQNGRRSPDVDTLNLLADVLEVSVDELIGRDAAPQDPTADAVRKAYISADHITQGIVRDILHVKAVQPPNQSTGA